MHHWVASLFSECCSVDTDLHREVNAVALVSTEGLSSDLGHISELTSEGFYIGLTEVERLGCRLNPGLDREAS